jgi:nucleotide-binding universal stress UspA family protein
VNFNRIGVGVAFSPNLKANIYEAARLSLFMGSELMLIHVGKEDAKKTQIINGHLSEFEKQKLSYKIIFVNGRPVEAILNAIQENKINLMVLGALKQESFFKYYLGSIAREITRKAKCSVLLLINPSIKRVPCKHIVVNGLKDPKTEETIKSAFFIGKKLSASKITIVEEIAQEEINIKVDDDRSLRESTIIRERLRLREKQRVKKLIKSVPNEQLEGVGINSQPIFGQRGYSIGHYAQVVRADLLVMNAPSKVSFWDKLFPNDIEYILEDLPTDVLIIR